MNVVIKAEPAFDVIGITIRTTTQENLQGHGPIAQLWQRFFAEQALERIPNKLDNAILGLYYDYESDKDGAYTLLIGVRVSSASNVPEGMTAKHVPAEKRALYSTEGGVMGIVKAWQDIWQSEDNGTLPRSYKVDYELYDDLASDPAHARAEIHLGV